MALLDSEVRRIRVELGYNALSYEASPYIGVASLFEQVIQQYLLAGATTTSTTAVDAAASPTLVTLTLASVTGIHVMDRVVVDVDDWQETATVRSIAGSTIDVLLSGAHSGSYPVTVEGGESLVREKLRAILATHAAMGADRGTGALKKVDEIEFFAAGNTNATSFEVLHNRLEFYRDELARVLGVSRLSRGGSSAGRGGGGRMTLM
jgi:hypothetical protein